jgi:hypothetical protein
MRADRQAEAEDEQIRQTHSPLVPRSALVTLTFAPGSN